jgi:hypothetical protein
MRRESGPDVYCGTKGGITHTAQRPIFCVRSISEQGRSGESKTMVFNKELALQAAGSNGA